jgi:NTE family protein
MMFTLGGPFRLGAYEYQEFMGTHVLLSSLGYRHQIGNLSPLWGGRIYGIAWFDAGGAYSDFNSPVVQYQGSAGAIMDTRLGSFALIGASGKGGAGKFYATFGRFF